MSDIKDLKKLFTKKLLRWNLYYNKRQMPWKGEKDPYKIWLSEIILQQTRVEQGLGYYNRFIKTFPTVSALAKAPETSVYKLWEGLGYYSRCKNLIASAKFIDKELNGKFPSSYETIIALKGIGPYTAAAIGSFAFDLPYAVVDGNVFRVLSRFFGIKKPIDSSEGKKLFTKLANELLDKKQPGKYNQALMDFGATICKPQLPLCNECVLKPTCSAYLKGMVAQLPVKEKKITKTTRWFSYLLISQEDGLFLRKRNTKDIWQNLYEFVLIETPNAITTTKLKTTDAFKNIVGTGSFKVTAFSKPSKQLLSHQTIYSQFIHIRPDKPINLKGYKLVAKGSLKRYPFSRNIAAYLSGIRP
jgi:A/G-specific adenine glycosylase